MVRIELKQKTHFDLIELLTTLRHDYYGVIEKYDYHIQQKNLDQWTKDYLNDNQTKAIYAKCLERLEMCDRIISELKQEPSKNACDCEHNSVSIVPQLDNSCILMCVDCNTEISRWKGDPRFE